MTTNGDHRSVRAGQRPRAALVNKGSRPPLIVDGEELVGAKQNRVVNLTILVAAASTLKIPVSCIEAGRWSARGAVCRRCLGRTASALEALARETTRGSMGRASREGRSWWTGSVLPLAAFSEAATA
jgi:hypothetical protein